MMLGRGRREATEHDAIDAARCCRQFGGNRAHGDARRAIGRKSIVTGGDRGKRDRVQPIRGGKIERGAVAGCQQFILARAAAVPYRPNGMDHMLRKQPVATRDLRAAGLTAAERAALASNSGPAAR